MVRPNSFSKRKRIKSSREITMVLRRGGCAADDCLVVFALPSEETHPRLGVTIPKKTGNAVVRNRWKRLIRESFRTQQDRLPVGYRFVVRPKKDAQPSWEKVRKSLPKLAEKSVRRIKPTKTRATF